MLALFSDAETWWIAALALLGLAGWAFLFRYWVFGRFPLGLRTHTLYRLRVHGREHIPSAGPVLLVSNHVSFIDALLILAAQRRRVRFIMWSRFLRVPGL